MQDNQNNRDNQDSRDGDATESRPDACPADGKTEDSDVYGEAFWRCGVDLEDIPIRIAPPATPLEILETLGPSPFERTGFPLMGFLATTYEKVSRYAQERGASLRQRSGEDGR